MDKHLNEIEILVIQKSIIGMKMIHVITNNQIKRLVIQKTIIAMKIGMKMVYVITTKVKKITKKMEDLITESLKYYQVNNPGYQDKMKRYTLTETGEKYLGEDISTNDLNWNLVQAKKNFQHLFEGHQV
ncbi:uncharacterized protein LOC103315549 [Nasonia vitripennis]|uniref:Uncharacterized protein n=1 Tax=Nasonia vitripennis TaxID=7425 RepID=A0A7M7R3G6_NASVI|nr:uncharacterized protein LOC103315549 [Nasonia vitripennis]XP_031784028.1 uncharacterized protein LOC103315549 [Nasonia vitripennis]XP_032457808.1 uncharacterized protein LOC103315549 [Nasonia vitripennis]